MSSRPARRHHFLPQFFVRRWVAPGRTTIFVRDLATNTVTEQTPRATGWARDFYRVNVPGLRTDAVEGDLSRIESAAADVLRRIDELRDLPHGEDQQILMIFMALMALRVPAFRQALTEPTTELVHDLSRAVTSSRKAWEDFLRAAGPKAKRFAKFSHEEAAQIVQKGEFKVTFEPTYHVEIMLRQLPDTTQMLGARLWSLAVAGGGTPGFITSDLPVYLGWTSPTQTFFSPGLALRGTEVVFPLSPGLCLIGTWEGPARVTVCDRRTVAEINNRLAMQAPSILVSTDDAFELVMEDERIVPAGEAFYRLQETDDSS